MTIKNNFKSRPGRLKFIHLLYFSLSGLDLKFLFVVTGVYYESGLWGTVEVFYVGWVCTGHFIGNQESYFVHMSNGRAYKYTVLFLVM